MDHMWSSMKGAISRRSFLRNGLTAAGGAASGAALLSGSNSLFADDDQGERDGRITKGDAALLRFAAAAEILETDFWVQYNELAGIQDSEEPSGTGNPLFTAALSQLDSDMAQYVHDNTDDEFTHQNFLNAYLMSKGEAPANLEQFRTLDGSTATGSSGKKRLTNLMRLTLDTSWWTRYRSDANNPDLDPNFSFSLRRSRRYSRVNTRRSQGQTTIPPIQTFFRRLQIRPASTCQRSSRAETASIHQWRREPPVLKFCAY